MTLSEARTAFLHAERLAIQFPRNAACQRMRQHAYAGWLQAVRNYRNGVCAVQEAQGWSNPQDFTSDASERL